MLRRDFLKFLACVPILPNLMTAGSSPRRAVSMGVVTRETTRLVRKCIRIKAEDSPNVQLGLAQRARGIAPTNEVIVPGVLTYAEYVERRATKDKVWQCVSLDADWYEGAENLLYPPEWLNYAETVADQLEGTNRVATSMGVDPGEGVASTVWCIIDKLGLMHLLSLKTPDTSTIPAQTIALLNTFHLSPEKCFFDRGGGGKQHADRLRTLGYDVQTVAFGETVTQELKRGMTLFPERKELQEEKYVYKNRRAQMYGELSLLLDPQFDVSTGLPKREITFALPRRYTELRRQLAPVPKWYDDEGRLFLPPKQRKPGLVNEQKTKTMIDLIGCSPDEADALVLAVYGLQVKPQMVAGRAF